VQIKDIHFNNLLIPQLSDVAHRWLAEKALVSAIELSDAFVANLKGYSQPRQRGGVSLPKTSFIGENTG
jgi:hypothetical protein